MAIIRYTAIYNADGGLWGETRYVIGHLLDTTACSLTSTSMLSTVQFPDLSRRFHTHKTRGAN